MRKIPLMRPFMSQQVKDRVCRVLDSGFLTEGPVTHEFETRFAEYIGAKFAIAATSCTTGLEMALRALDIGPGDEVIVPDYTYPATASVGAIVGATVVVVDVQKSSMLIDYDALEAAITPRTKAILPVSLFGNPLDYDRLKALKDKYRLHIIEDAACSIGAGYKGRKVGSFADIAVFSLHPRKFITTGEGGVVVTDNAEWAAWINSYKHFGMSAPAERQAVCFERVGTNYKLSDILAAVGLEQLLCIDALLARRIALGERYLAMLQGCRNIQVPATVPEGQHSYQSFCVFIDERDRVMQAMRADNIEVQIGTYSLHLQPAFQNSPHFRLCGEMAGSRYACSHCLTLPLYHDLTAADQERVVEKLMELAG